MATVSSAVERLTVRYPYRCSACGRSWSMFLLEGLVRVRLGCIFCGLLRVYGGAAMVLQPGGGEVALWRVELQRDERARRVSA
jgi:hypothetical protein